MLSIGDGDTISVLERGQKLKERLACIDAPETAQMPFGVASRNQLKTLLPLGSTVSLRVQAVDRYGRTVAEVIGKGTINLAMVQSGQAFVYRQYLGRCDRQSYLSAERQAQDQRLGVWAVPGGMTRPWDFRHGGVGAPQRRGGPRWGNLKVARLESSACPAQRGQDHLQADRLVCPGPGAVAAGAQLSGSQWGWGGYSRYGKAPQTEGELAPWQLLNGIHSLFSCSCRLIPSH